MVAPLLLISRILSYSVILLSVCMKLPQVWRTYQATDTRGISIRGYWLEIFGYSTGIAYAYVYSYDITTYLDVVLCLIQSIVIIILAVTFSKSWNQENTSYAVMIISFFMGTMYRVIPISILNALMSVGILISSSSKLLQINALYSSKTSANVSTLTWSIATYNCWARVFTTAVEVGDTMIVMNYLISAILNTIIVVQCVYYSSNINRKVQ